MTMNDREGEFLPMDRICSSHGKTHRTLPDAAQTWGAQHPSRCKMLLTTYNPLLILSY